MCTLGVRSRPCLWCRKTADVVSAFGHFVKFLVSVDEPAPTATSMVKRAFQMMMVSQINICKPCLPKFVEEKTKKDELFNDLLRFVKLKD